MAISEAETVIKRILPYLQRRGYDIAKDLKFEDPVALHATGRLGFIDVLVHCGRANPVFLIEAKRDGTKISAKHQQQALEYGASIKVLLVAVTNGHEFVLLNTKTKKPLQINGVVLGRIPSRGDLLAHVLPQMKQNPEIANLRIAADRSLPYRPGLPLSKLNHLIKQCHNSIRKIEKNEENAFSDFSKFMFLKLLEEKWDEEGAKPLYSYQFHDLAALPPGQGDKVRDAIKSMIQTIKDRTPYGEVLNDPLRLKQDASYQKIVRLLSSVSFNDCDLDAKGAAFEYFVRATLKGKKLGQYFTPRPLVKLMLALGRWEQIVNSIAAGDDFKVVDPACGTGGFLVLAMNMSLAEIDDRLKAKKIHKATADTLRKRVKQDVFFGLDAHEGVACSAKMNMIIAGDGANNIRCADSLNEPTLIPAYDSYKGQEVLDGKAHLVITNPPFGTSESESLEQESAATYEIASTRGQSLFVQKMIRAARPDSLIVTVIDRGVLNTASYATLRKHVMQQCRVEMVLDLPDETFKPNKINVRSCVLLLRRRDEPDEDLTDGYPIAFVSIKSLGYDGAGNETKDGFDLTTLTKELCAVQAKQLSTDSLKEGHFWSGFSVTSPLVAADKTMRLDVGYWHPHVREETARIASLSGSKSIKDINQIETRRGASPVAAEYVSESEGYALVVKSGSNISKGGELVLDGADYIERPLFEEDYVKKGMVLQDGDILLASTGDGTLGKCCVYRNNDAAGKPRPAVPEGHVTVIRVNQTEIYPEYLCDYLRTGFGHDQIYRLLTGSTGMVEITPAEVDAVMVPPLPSISDQRAISDELRERYREARKMAEEAVLVMRDSVEQFRERSLPPAQIPKING